MRAFFCLMLLVRAVGADAPLAVPDLINGLNDIAVAHPKADTDLKNDAVMSEVIRQATTLADGKALTMSCVVENVKAGDRGVSLRLKSPNSVKLTPNKLSTSWDPDFVVTMPIAQASTLNKGDAVVVRGVLQLFPKRWGAVGITTHTKQLWTVAHADLTWIGTLCLKSYEVVVGGTAYPGVMP